MKGEMPNRNQDYMLNMQNDIRHGLCVIDEKENWLDLYEEWREEKRNSFIYSNR